MTTNTERILNEYRAKRLQKFRDSLKLQFLDRYAVYPFAMCLGVYPRTRKELRDILKRDTYRTTVLECSPCQNQKFNVYFDQEGFDEWPSFDATFFNIHECTKCKALYQSFTGEKVKFVEKGDDGGRSN